MEWALLPLKRYAQFEGRSCRKEFWFFFLLYLGVSLLAGLIDGIIGLYLLRAIALLALIIPYLAVGVRRLHDTDRSGWWLLIGFIPLIGAIVLIVFFAQKGVAGANKYGADPLGGDPTVFE